MCEVTIPSVAYVSCILGDYDFCFREPIEQQYEGVVSFFAFTDDFQKVSPGSKWTQIAVGHHTRDLAANGHEYNSIPNNMHTFNISKYYKCLAHKCPELEGYDIIIWLDGTIEITHPLCTQYVVDKLNDGNEFVLYNHERRSNFFDESRASTFERYTSKYWNGQSQPYQYVLEQGDAYAAEGCHSGLWITCFIAQDHRKVNTKRCMERWYTEILNRTTQDQISFPYIVWKTCAKVYTLPDAIMTKHMAHEKTDLYIKHNHKHA